MKVRLIIILTMLFSTMIYSQENKKVDSLSNEVKKLESKISEIKDKINSEIEKNGFIVTVEKKYSFSKLLLNDKKYGKPIDTLKTGDKVKILEKEISKFKVEYKGKTGWVDDLKIDSDSNLKFLRYNYQKKKNSYSKSSYSRSTYVKGHYRTSKSGKRVYVKGHRRKK